LAIPRYAPSLDGGRLSRRPNQWRRHPFQEINGHSDFFGKSGKCQGHHGSRQRCPSGCPPLSVLWWLKPRRRKPLSDDGLRSSQQRGLAMKEARHLRRPYFGGCRPADVSHAFICSVTSASCRTALRTTPGGSNSACSRNRFASSASCSLKRTSLFKSLPHGGPPSLGLPIYNADSACRRSSPKRRPDGTTSIVRTTNNTNLRSLSGGGS
jgi:hypothetical protein